MLGRVARAVGRDASDLAALRRRHAGVARRRRRGDVRPPPRCDRAADPRRWRHAQPARADRAGNVRARLVARSAAADRRSRRLGADRARRDPARATAVAHAGRPLRPAAPAARCAAAAGAGLSPQRLPAAGARRHAGRRHAPAHCRVRRRARRRWPLVGGLAAHAVAVRPRLCVAQPADRLAPVPRGFPRAARAAHRQQLPPPARHGAAAGGRRCRAPGRRPPAAHRLAHARPVQRDLLRARVPGALPRLVAGRRRRPHRARRSFVPAHGRRPGAGARRHPPPRRRLLRPARTAPRLGARRCRAGAGCARRQRRHGQCAGQRLSRIERGARLSARHRPQVAR